MGRPLAWGTSPRGDDAPHISSLAQLCEAGTREQASPEADPDGRQQTKTRIGKQRGAKVAQIDLARRLAEAIWHMLSRGEPFAPKGATDPLAA